MLHIKALIGVLYPQVTTPEDGTLDHLHRAGCQLFKYAGHFAKCLGNLSLKRHEASSLQGQRARAKAPLAPAGGPLFHGVAVLHRLVCGGARCAKSGPTHAGADAAQ